MSQCHMPAIADHAPVRIWPHPLYALLEDPLALASRAAAMYLRS